MENENVFHKLSYEAFSVAQELRDLNDDEPERKKETLDLCTTLTKYLGLWEKTENVSQFAVNKKVFQIFSQARTKCGLPQQTSKGKVVLFAKNALALTFLPHSLRRENAVKFFEWVGKKFQSEYEKNLAHQEEMVS